MNVHNKSKKYNGKKYLSFMLFYSVEVLSNIECYWVLGEIFYKLLIPNNVLKPGPDRTVRPEKP